jgi:hypothetical protein
MYCIGNVNKLREKFIQNLIKEAREYNMVQILIQIKK